MVAKNNPFELSLETVEIDGVAYHLKQMSALDYIEFAEERDKIHEDKKLSELMVPFYQAALICSFSVVDDKGKRYVDPKNYKQSVNNINPGLLMKLQKEVVMLNGLNQTDEDLAKN